MNLREYRNIYSDNPVIFLIDLVQAIKDGFYVENSIEGFPALHGILKEVKTFKGIDAEPTPEFFGANIHIQDYDSTVFLLRVQTAVLQGYELDTNSVRFDSLKECTMFKTEEMEPKEKITSTPTPKRTRRTANKTKQEEV